jgi:hypothetical protein
MIGSGVEVNALGLALTFGAHCCVLVAGEKVLKTHRFDLIEY